MGFDNDHGLGSYDKPETLADKFWYYLTPAV